MYSDKCLLLEFANIGAIPALEVPSVQELLSVRSARPGKITYHVNLHHLSL